MTLPRLLSCSRLARLLLDQTNHLDPGREYRVLVSGRACSVPLRRLAIRRHCQG